MNVFEGGKYASTLGQRIRRGFELGPKYYLIDVPRYLRQRRRLGLPLLDLEVLWNPVRSFRNTSYQPPPLPPAYGAALEALASANIRFDNPRSRIEALAGMWWKSRDIPGDVIECGAYRGATSLFLAVLGRLAGLRQRVHVLDTFSGMPAPSDLDSSRQAGEFAPPAGWVAELERQARVLGVDDRVEIHQGLFADTFERLAPRDPKFAFVHIDANIYAGTLDACEFTIPRALPGAAIVFDDYNGLMDLGARLAIDEYLTNAHRPKPMPLAECSAYLIA